jgi:hypothetical protein
VTATELHIRGYLATFLRLRSASLRMTRFRIHTQRGDTDLYGLGMRNCSTTAGGLCAFLQDYGTASGALALQRQIRSLFCIRDICVIILSSPYSISVTLPASPRCISHLPKLLDSAVKEIPVVEKTQPTRLPLQKRFGQEFLPRMTQITRMKMHSELDRIHEMNWVKEWDDTEVIPPISSCVPCFLIHFFRSAISA